MRSPDARDDDGILVALAAIAGSTEPEALLRTTLDLTLRLVRGRLGYAALGRPESPSWCVLSVADPTDTDAVLARVSSTVRRVALTEGRAVVTASAELDPRFQHGASVRAHGVKAVICAPLGAADAPGVLYIEGEPGVRFTDADVRLVEGVARIAAQATRSLLARVADGADPTAPFRARLKAAALRGLHGVGVRPTRYSPPQVRPLGDRPHARGVQGVPGPATRLIRSTERGPSGR